MDFQLNPFCFFSLQSNQYYHKYANRYITEIHNIFSSKVFGPKNIKRGQNCLFPFLLLKSPQKISYFFTLKILPLKQLHFLFEQLQIQSLHLNIEYLNSDLTSIMFDKYQAKQDAFLMKRASKISIQNSFLRGFNSPKHENNITIDYNTYMNNQKSLLRQESFMFVPNQKNKKEIGGYHKKENIFGVQDYKVNQLAKQNDFLINQLMKSKQKQEKYQKAINRLKRCKSETILQPSYQSLIKINETKCSESFSNNCITSKLTKQTENSQKRLKTSQYNLEQHQKCKQLLEQSSMYIHHSRKSMAWQIEELNNRLCSYIERSTVEMDNKARNNYRFKIAECVKQLKELRRLYEETYC